MEHKSIFAYFKWQVSFRGKDIGNIILRMVDKILLIRIIDND